MRFRRGIGDDDFHAGVEGRADGAHKLLRCPRHCSHGDADDLEVHLLLDDHGDVRRPHRGACVTGDLGLLETLTPQELRTSDGVPIGCRMGRRAERDDSRAAEGRHLVDHGLRGRADVAPEGGVDPVADESGGPAGAHDRRDTFRGDSGVSVPAVGGGDDDVEAGDHLCDQLGPLRGARGHGSQTCPGEAGGSGVGTGQVVGHDEHIGHVRGRGWR
jgi:hypothetical protein